MFIVIIIVLFIVTFYLYNQNRRIKKENNVLYPFIQLIEQTHDVAYAIRIAPTLHYTYLSPSFDSYFGEGEAARHLSDPMLIFERIHPDDHEQLKAKTEGKISVNTSLFWRVKNKHNEYIWFEEFIMPIYDKVFIVMFIYQKCYNKSYNIRRHMIH